MDELLVGTHRKHVLDRQDLYLSQHSNVEVFEAGRNASKRQKMDDSTFTSYLKVRLWFSTRFCIALTLSE